ncbi:DUF421 domain-containing protein [Paenibacillus antri]|uniref:DUF421 domain-containing protein n=1 Tax=Paenibacillus antri TaxID=2582848 RepID=A0A5R9GJA6_9BACL|nr:DUF421 domain-containing protein [Paenibacillus antri]TLS53564.1 DUF421 domain-containing protein [Paenibacillus antri]
MEAVTIFSRTVLIYFVIYLAIRMMGKREIGKLSVFDLVISIMITELAVIVVENPERPLWEGIGPMLLLALLQIVIAFVTLKSRRLRLLFEGKASPIISNGKLDRDEMKRQRYSLDDLMLQLREKNVMNVADVEFAVLEPTGRLALMKKEEYDSGNTSGERAGKAPPDFRFVGLPVPLIMDGKVQKEGLEKIGQTRFWLKRELESRGVKDAKDVFLCTVDHRGRWFIDKK